MDVAAYLQSLPTAAIFIVPFLLFTGILAIRRKKFRFPPGPRRLPIIGNMLMMNQLTHRGLAKLSDKYGGLFYLRLGFLHSVVVSDPDTAREVLQTQDNIFSNRPATMAVRYLTYDRADMAFAHYGPFWRQMRKICVMKLFSHKRAESWASVREEVDDAINAIQKQIGSPVNIGELVFSLTRNITYRAAFGSNSHEGQDEFVLILQEFSKLMGVFNIADFIPWLSIFGQRDMNVRLQKARGSLDRFIDKIIDDHMNKKQKKLEQVGDSDMVDELMTFLGDKEEGGVGEVDDLQGSIKLTRDNIKAIVMDVMFGGTETVASAIEWAMAELLKSPQDLKKVQQELKDVVGLNRKVNENDIDKLFHLKCVIKETLRLHPPIPLLLHETAEDSIISGYSIPVGSRVTINAWAIGRNKKAWVEPELFNPTRFYAETAPDFRGNFFELIPFGSGRRSCPGMQLGLYALEMAVAHFVHSFSWKLPDGMKPSDLDMSDIFGLTAPRAQPLVAIPTPRLQCPIN